MSHGRKLRTNIQLSREINAMMHMAKALDDQKDRQYGYSIR